MAVTPPGSGHLDDPESPDAATPGPADAAADPTLDVTPRSAPTARAGRRSGGSGRVLGIVAVVVILGGLGVVVFNGLRSASTFFYNVDEALAKRDELDDKRFRMQGNVVAGTVEETDDGVSFVLAYGGERIGVDHVGDPPELFGPKIPVVLEGTFAGDRFASDEILVKHDNSYEEEHDDRIRDAERDADTQAGGAGG